MEIEAPPVERASRDPDGERRALVIVRIGNCKGKSTAVFDGAGVPAQHGIEDRR